MVFIEYILWTALRKYFEVHNPYPTQPVPGWADFLGTDPVPPGPALSPLPPHLVWTPLADTVSLFLEILRALSDFFAWLCYTPPQIRAVNWCPMSPCRRWSPWALDRSLAWGSIMPHTGGGSHTPACCWVNDLLRKTLPLALCHPSHAFLGPHRDLQVGSFWRLSWFYWISYLASDRSLKKRCGWFSVKLDAWELKKH